MRDVNLSTLLDGPGCCAGGAELDDLLHRVEVGRETVRLIADRQDGRVVALIVPGTEDERETEMTVTAPYCTVYVSIGNSDDKLTQQRWAAFYGQVCTAVRANAERIYGEWLSAPQSQWQNACIGFTVTLDAASHLKADLRTLAGHYGQDSIAWAEVGNDVLLERSIAAVPVPGTDDESEG